MSPQFDACAIQDENIHWRKPGMLRFCYNTTNAKPETFSVTVQESLHLQETLVQKLIL
jgi:hypothetical protein